MTSPTGRFGLSCALTTPFRADGSLDLPRLAAHARGVIARGCGGVTAFGTTGEGSSLGIADRHQMLGALHGAGLDFRVSLVGGVMASSLGDAAEQSRLVLDAGGRALLLAPPFYFKGVSDEGLFAWFSALFETLGAAARDVILYNIPSVTAVPLSLGLVGRLRTAFPEIVIGVKDSSGDWQHTRALLAEHRDLAILVGDERHLAEAVRLGAQGAISGLANIAPERLLPLAVEGRNDEGIVRVVEGVLRFPVTPAVKSLLADQSGFAGWRHVRAPLRALSDGEAATLRDGLAGVLPAPAAA